MKTFMVNMRNSDPLINQTHGFIISQATRDYTQTSRPDGAASDDWKAVVQAVVLSVRVSAGNEWPDEFVSGEHGDILQEWYLRHSAAGVTGRRQVRHAPVRNTMGSRQPPTMASTIPPRALAASSQSAAAVSGRFNERGRSEGAVSHGQSTDRGNSRRGLRASVEPPRRAENADMEVESRERTDGGTLQSTLDAMARMSASAQAHGRDLAARAASGECWPRGDFASRGNSGHVVGTSVEHAHHAEHAGMVEESRERVDRKALRAYNVGVIRRAAREAATELGRHPINGRRQGITAVSDPSTVSDEEMEEVSKVPLVSARPPDPRPSRGNRATRDSNLARPSVIAGPAGSSRVVRSPPVETGNVLGKSSREHGRSHTMSPS